MAIPIIPIALALVGAPGILQGLMNMFPPFAALTARRGYKDRPDLIPTIEQQINLRIQGQLDAGEYTDLMAQAGIAPDIAEKLYDASQTYLTAADYALLWRRGKIDESARNEALAKLGIRSDRLQQVLDATEWIAGPQDIIRFAVRDIYDPAVVSKYNYDANLPDAYLEAAAKVGIPHDTAVNFWRAHWQLPSLTQAYELLHRRLISEDDIRLILRLADVLPHFHEPLIKASYHPLTRVDVRRMHAMGVLSDAQVADAYRDLGYDEKNAQLMAEFTKRYNQGTEGEAPQINVMRAYRVGAIDRNQALTELGKLGYDLSAADILIATEDQARQAEIIDLEADAIIDNYNRGLITMDQVQTELTKIGVPAGQMSYIIARELAQSRKRIKSPTKSTLDKWYLSGLLDLDSYIRRMGILGYTKSDTMLYVAELDIKLVHSDISKTPYVVPMREYIADNISESELRTTLQGMGYEGVALEMMMDAAITAHAGGSTE